MIFCVLQKSKSLKVVFVVSDFSQESKQGVINHHTHKIKCLTERTWIRFKRGNPFLKHLQYFETVVEMYDEKKIWFSSNLTLLQRC